MDDIRKIVKMWLVSSMVFKAVLMWGLIVLGLGILTGAGLHIDISIGGVRNVTEMGAKNG